MSIFNRFNSPPPGKGICPHLGIAEDPQTSLAYASIWNLCHHVRHPMAVRLEHQRRSCLLPGHTACLAFQSERLAPLPAQLRWRRGLPGPGMIVLLAALLVLVLGSVLWLAWRNYSTALPVSTQAPLETNQPEPPQVAHTPVTGELAGASGVPPVSLPATPTPPAPTPASSASPAARESCGYELEDRIELDRNVLVLHRVASGENMILLAEKYGTSIQAIRALNYFLPSPLWADLVIVIPLGSSATDGLPLLEPYFILDPLESLDALARQVSVPGADLVEYNSLDVSCLAYAGWLLVPHASAKNP